MVKSFDSSEPSWIYRKQLWASCAAGISRTLLLPAVQVLPNGMIPICSFYTITACSIKRKTLPMALARKLPHYPVPVFLLAQLAVDVNFHSQGLGKITLIKALENLWGINSQMRAYAVVVDCLNETAKQFYEKYGFTFLCRHKGRNRLFLPMKTISQLF